MCTAQLGYSFVELPRNSREVTRGSHHSHHGAGARTWPGYRRALHDVQLDITPVSPAYEAGIRLRWCQLVHVHTRRFHGREAVWSYAAAPRYRLSLCSVQASDDVGNRGSGIRILAWKVLLIICVSVQNWLLHAVETCWFRHRDAYLRQVLRDEINGGTT